MSPFGCCLDCLVVLACVTERDNHRCTVSERCLASIDASSEAKSIEDARAIVLAADIVVRRLRPIDPEAGRADAFKKSSKSLPANAVAASRSARSWSLRFAMLFAESPVAPDDAPQRPNELMRERGRLIKQGVGIAQGMKHMMLEYLALQYVTEEGEPSTSDGTCSWDASVVPSPEPH